MPSVRRAPCSLGWNGRFWITESGYTTRGIYPNTVPERDYPSELVKTVTLLATTGAEKVVWYTLTDRYSANEEPKGENLTSVAETYFGLAYPDFTPKRGAYAFSAIAGVIPGSTSAPRAITMGKGTRGVHVFPFIREDGRLVLVAWADAPVTLELSLNLQGEIPAIDGPERRSYSGRILEIGRQPVILVSDLVPNPDGSDPIGIQKTSN